MPASIPPPRPGQSAARRALHYAFYDWSQEVPRSKRVLVWLGIFLQGYAIYAAITRSLIWPLIWPRDGLLLYCWLLYVIGGLIVNGMLTSELLRKTQLESDLAGARHIPEALIRAAVAGAPTASIGGTALVDRQLNEDDITIVLVKRSPVQVPG